MESISRRRPRAGQWARVPQAVWRMRGARLLPGGSPRSAGCSGCGSAAGRRSAAIASGPGADILPLLARASTIVEIELIEQMFDCCEDRAS